MFEHLKIFYVLMTVYSEYLYYLKKLMLFVKLVIFVNGIACH